MAVKVVEWVDQGNVGPPGGPPLNVQRIRIDKNAFNPDLNLSGNAEIARNPLFMGGFDPSQPRELGYPRDITVGFTPDLTFAIDPLKPRPSIIEGSWDVPVGEYDALGGNNLQNTYAISGHGTPYLTGSYLSRYSRQFIFSFPSQQYYNAHIYAPYRWLTRDGRDYILKIWGIDFETSRYNKPGYNGLGQGVEVRLNGVTTFHPHITPFDFPDAINYEFNRNRPYATIHLRAPLQSEVDNQSVRIRIVGLDGTKSSWGVIYVPPVAIGFAETDGDEIRLDASESFDLSDLLTYQWELPIKDYYYQSWQTIPIISTDISPVVNADVLEESGYEDGDNVPIKLRVIDKNNQYDETTVNMLYQDSSRPSALVDFHGVHLMAHKSSIGVLIKRSLDGSEANQETVATLPGYSSAMLLKPGRIGETSEVYLFAHNVENRLYELLKSLNLGEDWDIVAQPLDTDTYKQAFPIALMDGGEAIVAKRRSDDMLVMLYTLDSDGSDWSDIQEIAIVAGSKAPTGYQESSAGSSRIVLTDAQTFKFATEDFGATHYVL